MSPLGLYSDMGPDMPAGRGIGERGKALRRLQSPEWSVRTRFLFLDSAAKMARSWTLDKAQQAIKGNGQVHCCRAYGSLPGSCPLSHPVLPNRFDLNLSAD